MLDSVKIRNFKAGIRPEAGLESALDIARGLLSVGNNFDNFVNNITEGVINRRSRREMFRSTGNTREVAAYGRGGRGRGGRGRVEEEVVAAEVEIAVGSLLKEPLKYRTRLL